MNNQLAIKKINIFSVVTLIFIIIIGISKNAMSQNINPDINYYYLKVEINDAIASIYINDVPIVKSLDTDTLITTEPVNQWLIKGKNILSYKIHGDSESNTNHAPKIQASIFLHDINSETPRAKETLSEIEFISTPNSEYPNYKAIDFTYNDIVTTKLWDDAETFTSINDKDRSEILNIAKSFADSIINEEYENAIQYQIYKIHEEALAEGKTLERILKVTKSTYDWVGTQGKLKNTPIDPKKLKYEFCFNNKLIYLVRSNNEEAIILESEELYMDIATFFAKIKGKWTIVR